MRLKSLVLVFGLSFASIFSFSQTKSMFNTDEKDIPTIMVLNVSKEGGGINGISQPGIGNWKKFIFADAGDTIAVQIYFHNSTLYRTDSATLSLLPKRSTADNFHAFVGGVASTTIDRSEGYAIVMTTPFEKVTFIPGSVRIYKHGSPTAYQVQKEASLFTEKGLSIGAISPGWDFQGTLSAEFVVSDN
ncbi:MAG: hypothetical protein JST21_08110 [Bacteroidetes bacterium]|nr:hypothetical protein [Bacteroidota bacterium]